MRLRADGDWNTAYLSLDDTAAVANRLVFTSEDHRQVWGIDLDFDAHGHLVDWSLRTLITTFLSDCSETATGYERSTTSSPPPICI